MVSEALLVTLLDRRPLISELLILNVLEETLELCEVLEPDTLVQLQRF